MLTHLRISHVVLIEEVSLDFAHGLCALTGETGAGKSILLDSLGLVTGARADSALVRKGAAQAGVTASFDLPPGHISQNLMQEAGLSWDQTLILRRSLTPDGRSKAFINDQPVSVTLLKQIGETLIEIHGQFDTQGLLNPASHRQMLDDYAGLENALLPVWQDWQQAKTRLAQIKAESAASKLEEEYLRGSVDDLSLLAPQTGEEDTLAALRERLMNREQVLGALSAAYNALNAEEDPVRSAWAMLDKIAGKLGPEGEGIIAALERANTEMQEASGAIEALSQDLSESEHDLESIDDRLFALRAQARKFSCAVDDLPAKLLALKDRLESIDHAEAYLAKAQKAVEIAKAAYLKEANVISAARKAAAARLDALVAKELPPLKLEKARFVTAIEPLEEDQYSQHGIDKIRFLVATNPGAEPGALNKIASGGEMSRFMLALKVVMAEVGAAGTLIFDEVDAGIGGAVADAVGERLARLSKDRQVMVVTHAPQVAARAAHHYIVHKGGSDTVTTNVTALNSRQERSEEIARMLAGATVTEEARAAANKLLETGT